MQGEFRQLTDHHEDLFSPANYFLGGKASQNIPKLFDNQTPTGADKQAIINYQNQRGLLPPGAFSELGSKGMLYPAAKPNFQAFNHSSRSQAEGFSEKKAPIPSRIKNEHLLIMTIDLGEGINENLNIFVNDDPFELAKNFCEKHELSEEAIEILAKNIESNMMITLQERRDRYIFASAQEEELEEEEDSNRVSKQKASQNEELNHNNAQKYNETEEEPEWGRAQNWNRPNSSPNSVFRQRVIDTDSKPYFSAKDESAGKLFFQSPKDHHEASSQKGSQISVNIYAGNASPKFRPDPKKSVYDRLHQDAMYKQRKMKTVNKSFETPTNFRRSNGGVQSAKSFAQSSTPRNQDIGNYLYEKGMRQKEAAQKRRAELRNQQLQTETKDLTFKPVLSDRTLRLAQSHGKKTQRNESLEDHLMELGRIKKEKLEKLRINRQKEELSQIHFKPEINKISQKIIEEKFKSTGNQRNIFDTLFEEAKTRREKQHEMAEAKFAEEYKFTPVLISAKQDFPHSGANFLERMEASIRQRQEKNKILSQSKADFLYDTLTGQQFFVPQTGRAPAGDRNSDRKPIGEYLYEKRRDLDVKMKAEIDKENRKLDDSKSRASELSSMIVDNIQRKRLEEIFCQLDSDSDGHISAQKIDIAKIHPKILEIFAPLLCEMEQMNFTLNFDMFYEASSRLMHSLPLVDRDKILYDFKSKWEERKKDYEKYSFRPEINKLSVKIAEKKNLYSPQIDLFTRAVEKKQLQNERIKEHQTTIFNTEMKECTFKPVLNSNYKIY